MGFFWAFIFLTWMTLIIGLIGDIFVLSGISVGSVGPYSYFAADGSWIAALILGIISGIFIFLLSFLLFI